MRIVTLLVLCANIIVTLQFPYKIWYSNHINTKLINSNKLWYNNNVETATTNNNSRLNKGLNILELIPGGQGPLVWLARELWRLGWYVLITELAPQSKSGGYVRTGYGIRKQVPSEEFPIEENRYHVYIGNPCPWCHRVGIAKALYGINDSLLGVTELVDDPTRASRGGWIIGKDKPKQFDPVFGAKDLKEIYDQILPDYEGRCTAPLLIDKKKKTIISNDSSHIMRILAAMASSKEVSSRLEGIEDTFIHNPYTASLTSGGSSSIRGGSIDVAELEELKEWLYNNLNNGVYRSGFSTKQDEHHKASNSVRDALLTLESRLANQRFLMSNTTITEADIFLLPTVERFDSVYATLFKCTSVRICELPNIRRWHRDMRCSDSEKAPQWALNVRKSFDAADALRSYFEQIFPQNPSRIIPVLPHWQETLLSNEVE